jgi:hypothetical protein
MAPFQYRHATLGRSVNNIHKQHKLKFLDTFLFPIASQVRQSAWQEDGVTWSALGNTSMNLRVT